MSLRGESRASRASSSIRTPDLSYEDDDEDYEYTDGPRGHSEEGLRLVIGIDYGTTFTGELVVLDTSRCPILTFLGVAFATPVGSVCALDQIEPITDWGDEMRSADKIPSVFSYSPSSNGERQFGSHLSPKALAMLNTKLGLDIQSVDEELVSVIGALDGMKGFDFQNIKTAKSRPDYPDDDAKQIITRYLGKVFDVLQSKLKRQFGETWMAQVPVDIVATVPTVGVFRFGLGQ
jgi:hypothetical protein